ncbi:MAG: plasmid mobilization relaxosome protein MobC [Bacteroidetes bacterium]|nr:plasmid mobilization relaxosome protein MobC [Bacteroidota bacterium]
MTRPRKNDIEKRIVQVNIRLTKDEADRADRYAIASGLSPANWIRQKVFSGKFPMMKISPLEGEIYRELKRIGVNLNQGTHRLNQGDVPKDYLVLQNELLTLLNKIIKLLIHDRQSD